MITKTPHVIMRICTCHTLNRASLVGPVCA